VKIGLRQHPLQHSLFTEGAFMIKWSTVFLILLAATFTEASGVNKSLPEMSALCSQPWEQFIERNVRTGDDRGHGPDLGSDEWKSTVEFKLGIHNSPDIPDRNSESWCRYIDQIVQSSRAPSPVPFELDPKADKAGPSFDCNKVETGSIEAMICEDEELSALDRNLATVYADASKRATNEHPPVLKAEQRGWIEGRNDCWKSADKQECVRDNYLHRIVELQARYRLVPFIGPVSYICDDNPDGKILVTFFQTDPPTLIAERGDSVSLMHLQPSGSGSKYRGRNEMFWEHHGSALLTWGYGAEELHCEKVP
jgi:uncharacterized protein